MSKILFIVSLFCCSNICTQFETKVFIQQSPCDNLFNISKVNVTKSGPYFGIQRGKFAIIEIGGEKQWKRVTWRKPKTHALRFGANYNFKYNVIGYDIGYWLKLGRLDLTYGCNLVCRTDFDVYSFGISPTIGYKFQQFHLQTGYHFLNRPIDTFETNSLFISLRYVFINERKWNVSKNQKSRKKNDEGFFERMKKKL